MKKNCFIFLFSFIYLSILAGCHIRPDEYEEFQNISLSVIGKQIAVETEKALKDKDNTLDELIKKLLAQMDANLAEEYWLYDYKSRIYGETCLELYADNAEDMHYLAILSSGKETFIETERFYTEIYFISEGNIHNLYASWGVCCSTLDEAKRALELQEEILERKFIYIDTIESYEWPQPKRRESYCGDLEASEIYQNFDVLVKERGGFDFPEGTEVYLGLWNGYSEETRMMYKMTQSDGTCRYYDAILGLDGGRCGSINETTEDVYERFKMISVKMKGYEKED